MNVQPPHFNSLAVFQARCPGRASKWRLRTRELAFSHRPLLMGIINVTPDSFSDGGRCGSHTAAIEHGLRLADDGADLLDVGGESTRPYATTIDSAEELRRVLPVVGALCEKTPLPVSIDTSKAAVASEAIAAGAEIINDITGLVGDIDMAHVARQTKAAVCVMHMQGTPQTMQDAPRYGNVVEEIFDWLRCRRDALMADGIDPLRICLDPGIGFGKTHEHNLTLLRHSGRFHALGCPLLVGHSRKGFIAWALGDKQADRDPATIGVALALARRGIQIIRVHEVRALRQALALFDAAGGILTE